MSDLRRRILSTRALQGERVVEPEWDNAELEIRKINVMERDRILEAATDKETERVMPGKLQVAIILATAHDPATGQKVFEDADRDTLLLNMSAASISRVAEVAFRLNGIGEEAAKNSSGASGSSSSDSPKTSA